MIIIIITRKHNNLIRHSNKFYDPNPWMNPRFSGLRLKLGWVLKYKGKKKKKRKRAFFGVIYK